MKSEMSGREKQNVGCVLVSVVVTTRNEEKNIGNCLLSIKEQIYPNIEIIVVDNASTDRTKDIARKYTQHVYDKGPERSAQRNYGMINIASGKYVMFIDADMILAPCLIEACVKKLERKDIAALFISEIVLGTSYWCKVRRFERSFYDATVIDSARIYRKDIFVQAGGFDEKIDFGEEWDIDKSVKKIGQIDLLSRNNSDCSNPWKLSGFIELLGIGNSVSQNVIYHNESDFNFLQYIRKKGNYAKGFDKYIDKWGKKDPDVNKQFGIYYRYFGVFVENGKWKLLAKKPHFSIGMYLLRFLVGIFYLYHSYGWLKR